VRPKDLLRRRCLSLSLIGLEWDNQLRFVALAKVTTYLGDGM
jgi:hypothetical protein